MRALHLYVIFALSMGVHYGAFVGCDTITTHSAGERHSRSKQTLLVLCEESIQAFDLETGADFGVFLSRNSTGGRTWGLDSIAEKDGLLYIGTYFGDAALPIAFPGAVQVFTCSGRYLRRFDQGFNLKRPYGLEFISSSSASVPTDSSRHGGSARRRQQLVVSGLGNDALVLYNAKSGQHDGFLAQGDNTTASPMGPNGMLVVGRTLFLATEGSTVVSGEVVYPAYLQSALLAVDLDTKAVKLVDTPSPSPNAGYVSLLGIALLPRHADIGLSTSSSIRRGGSSSSRVMVVSDYAGGLRYYSVAPPYLVLKVVDTTFIDPVTAQRTQFNYGSVRVSGRYIYLAAFDSSKQTLDGMVLRYNLDGTPAGVRSGLYAATPVWIGPSAQLTRATGLKVLGPHCMGQRP